MSSGASLNGENHLGTPFLSSRYGSCKCRFRLPGGDGKGDLGGQEHKGCEETLGKSETLSVSSQLGYLWVRECSADNPHSSLSVKRGKGEYDL